MKTNIESFVDMYSKVSSFNEAYDIYVKTIAMNLYLDPNDKNILDETLCYNPNDTTGTGFEEFLKNATPSFGGISKRWDFPNGYGASVIRHVYSYGFEDGLWELGVLKDGDLCYDTEITEDVLGYLSDDEVNDYLEKIKSL